MQRIAHPTWAGSALLRPGQGQPRRTPRTRLRAQARGSIRGPCSPRFSRQGRQCSQLAQPVMTWPPSKFHDRYPAPRWRGQWGSLWPEVIRTAVKTGPDREIAAFCPYRSSSAGAPGPPRRGVCRIRPVADRPGAACGTGTGSRRGGSRRAVRLGSLRSAEATGSPEAEAHLPVGAQECHARPQWQVGRRVQPERFADW